MLAVLGNSRHSVATLAGTATPRSEIAPLPLNAPLVRDVQHFLRGIWGRLRLMVGGMERSCQAVEDEDSVVVQLASWAGAISASWCGCWNCLGAPKLSKTPNHGEQVRLPALMFVPGRRKALWRGISRLFQQHDLMLLTALELDGKCREVQ